MNDALHPLMARWVHRCAIQGCPNIVGGVDYCARCEEEINGQPYALTDVLLPPERSRKIISLGLRGLGLAGLLILILL